MIILGLGSNITTKTTREENLIYALKLLDAHPKIKIDKLSSLYQTEPVGFTDQPDFLNCALSINTTLAPEELLAECLKIENEMGRKRTRRWGPRNIDIDLLFYNEVIWQNDFLELPHPRVPERKFVLIPLAELTGDAPIYKGVSAVELLNLTTDESLVAKYPSPLFQEYFDSLEKIGS